MNIQDITIEELETLSLIDEMKKYVNDETGDFKSLAEVVWNVADNSDNRNNFAKDICKLTKKGYLISDAEDELTSDTESEYNLTIDGVDIIIEDDDIDVPTVEGITPKGQSALNQLETEIKQHFESGKKFTLIDNLGINPTVEFNLIKAPEGGISVYKFLSTLIKKAKH